MTKVYDAVNFINDLNIMVAEYENMKRQIKAHKETEDRFREFLNKTIEYHETYYPSDLLVKERELLQILNKEEK